MQNIGEILGNRVLLVALLACFTAQVAKFFIELSWNRKFNPKVMFETGGLPSSHSALVSALAVGVGQAQGWSSVEFAIASVFAIIVMYDAAGVRQAAGKQARVLNQVIDECFQGERQFSEERLKEVLGHTALEVLAGSILGVIIAWLAKLIY